jgi:putative heme transporter
LRRPVGRRWVRVAVGLGSVAIAVALLALALPAIADVSWAAIWALLSALNTGTLVGLTVLWFGGLWVYTFVLTSSLPGLRHPQAFVLNCAGSAISNLVPFGGAAGVAVTFAMAGSWGHSRRAIAVSVTVSGAWNVLCRLALPVVGLGALTLAGHVPDERITVAVVVTCALLVVLVAVGAAALTINGETATRLLRGRRPWQNRRWLRPLVEVRRETIDVIRRGWIPLTLGMIGYLGMQYLLFRACLLATGADVSLDATVASFALSRILATTAITPGGIGVTESGTAALLIALGAPGAPVAAALIIFSFFTHAIEIPVGGVAWATWAAARRWRVRS